MRRITTIFMKKIEDNVRMKIERGSFRLSL